MKHIRSQNLQYAGVTRVVAPTPRPDLPFVGISCQLDGNSSSIKPKIVWVEDSQFPQRKEYHILLLRGDREVEHADFKNPTFLFTTYDQNRRTGGVATAWLVEPIPQPEKPVFKEPKRPKVDYTSPEAREALAAHEKKLRLKAQQDAALKEQEENLVDPVKTLEKNPLVEALEGDQNDAPIEEDAEDLLEEFFGEDKNE